MFYRKGQEQTFPSGQISRDVRNAYQDAQFRPPVIACWPLTAPNGISLESYRVAGREGLDGDEFIVLKKLRRGIVDEAEIWLQARPPFLPVRIIRFTNSRPSSELTIEYSHLPGEEWHPRGWKGTWLAKDGAYRMTAEATVTSYEFGPTVRDADFTIHFPPGTWVQDRTQPGEPIDFIQREDGRKRIILKEELRRGAQYQDLLDSDTGQATPRRMPQTPPSARRGAMPWAMLLDPRA